jgi:outer membrane protein assembly factor BamB
MFHANPQHMGHSFGYCVSLQNYLGTLGDLKWQYYTDAPVFSSPVISSNGTIYFSLWQYIYTLDSTTRNVKRTYRIADPPWLLISSPVIGNDGTIYIGTYDGYIYALNATGTLKWTYQTSNSIDSSPVIDYDGKIYVGSDDGYVYALNNVTGKLK